MRFTRLLSRFVYSERSGGLILIGCTILSLCITASPLQQAYQHFWHTSAGGSTLEHWINDGLMTFFFLLIGLELQREVYLGTLSNIRNAVLPIVAAIGGMLVPAAFYLLMNAGTNTQSGAGIPMATDIAFALGVLHLLGKRVPPALVVFLTALAVIDDLGAILVIAFFYSKGLLWFHLFAALGIWTALFIINRMKVKNLIPYLLGGVVMWWCMLRSGVHPTITGVLLAFVIPFANGDERSASYRLQQFLHAPVVFMVLPVFALANTAIDLDLDIPSVLREKYSLGIAMGLVIGKPLGILLFTYTAVQLRMGSLSKGVGWKSLAGVGLLGGIGFTMSIFITLLAFDDPEIINNAKLSILLSSLLAGAAGLAWLHFVLRKKETKKLTRTSLNQP